MYTRHVHSLFLVLLTAAPLEVVAGDAQSGFKPEENEVVDAIEVIALSVNQGVAAIKVTSHLRPTEDENSQSIDCNYPGMKDHPRSGVSIRVWSWAKRAFTDEFEIYALATNMGECSGAKQSKAQLAAAKAKISSLGMSLDKKPVAAREVFTTRVEAQKTGDEPEGTSNTVWFTAKGKRFYQIEYSYTPTAGGNASFDVLAAYVEGDSLVIFQHLRQGTLQGNEHWYSLSPVLKLPK